MKEKDSSNSKRSRMYDQEGYVQRAACVCVKNEAENEILLISSSSQLDQWVIPGGGVEQDETHVVAAVREVVEEAGVRGKIDRCLGMFENNERRNRTAVYVMVVTEELSEWEESILMGRKRKWFSFDEASEKLARYKPKQLDYLDHLRLKHKQQRIPTAESEAAPT